MRAFTDTPAVRTATSLLIALVGPSGSGKTFSAFRIATGIKRVTGGDIFVIDTESGRAKHYAPKKGQIADPSRGTFDFRHIQFDPPHSPNDYLAAFDHCIGKGAKTIIIDSASHEWEGIGGVLDMHEAELDRMAGNDHRRRESMNFPAWAKPKAQHNNFKLRVVQSNVNVIFCFRAKEKITLKNVADDEEEQPTNGRRPRKRREVVELGWQPISGGDLVYEMMIRCLLPPGSDGVPRWIAEQQGEKELFKLPQQFRHIFPQNGSVQLSEDVGTAMAKWAAGDVATDGQTSISADEAVTRFNACDDPATFRTINEHVKASWSTFKKPEKDRINAAANESKERMKAAEQRRESTPPPAQQQQSESVDDDPDDTREPQDFDGEFNEASAAMTRAYR